jgi:hypothetical protein
MSCLRIRTVLAASFVLAMLMALAGCGGDHREAMIADVRSGAIATGTKTMEVIPTAIEAIATNGSPRDLQPCRRDFVANGRRGAYSRQ